jgi:cytochrome c553
LDGNSRSAISDAGRAGGYLEKALKAYAGKVRNSSTMHAMADPLSETDIANIVTYFSSKQPKSVVYMDLPCLEADADQESGH